MSHGTKVEKDVFWEKEYIRYMDGGRPRLSPYIFDTSLRFAHIIMTNSILPIGEFNMDVNDRDVLFLAQMKGLHQQWKPNLGLFIIEHLKEVAKETRSNHNISIGAYVSLFANYLKIDIHEERVHGNPYINLTYLIDQRQLMTSWYKDRTEIHVYLHMADRLLGFIYAESLASTSKEATNTLEEGSTKALEKDYPPLLEGEHIKEPEEEQPKANQVVTRSISRERKGRRGRSTRRVRSRSRNKPYKVPSQALSVPEVAYVVTASDQETTEPSAQVSAQFEPRTASPIPHAVSPSPHEVRQQSRVEVVPTAQHIPHAASADAAGYPDRDQK